MKNVIFINGTMGSGKSATAKALNKILPRCVMLDGDWCWMADPFCVTDETKAMVTDNITHLLNNFIKCSAYENIIFCWVMDFESIYESLANRLNTENCNIYRFTIDCSQSTLKKHIDADIAAGIRKAEDYERSVQRLARFAPLNTVKINVDNLSAAQAAQAISDYMKK